MADATNTGSSTPEICRVCHQHDLNFLFRHATPYLDRAYEYNSFRCASCGFVQSEGPADDSVLDRIYGEQFHATPQQKADPGQDDLFSDSMQKFPVVRNATRRAEWLRAQGFEGTLLDVGAGGGYFVKAASNHFDACGVEISEKAVRQARDLGAQVSQGDFMTSDWNGRSFDVITMWDVLAGFREPQAVVQRLRSLQKPGGILVFTVPRASSLIARVLGRFWPLLIPPVNLSYFSEESIRVLLNTHGYKLVSMHCEGKRVALEFLILKALRTLGLSRAEQFAAWFRSDVSIPVNLRDILTVVARIENRDNASATGIQHT